MKKEYTPETLVSTVQALDVRAQKLSTDQINSVIDDAYTELCTAVQIFSGEEIVPLAAFYETGEQQITLDIEDDVSDLYDLYLTIEDKDKDAYDYGIEKIRDEKVIHRDNQYNGRVHIDLDTMTETANNAVLKYYYTPTSSTSSVYMDAQSWLALKSALGAALYDAVHDVERNGQKRSEMNRRAKAIITNLPEDAFEPAHGHIFYGLTH